MRRAADRPSTPRRQHGRPTPTQDTWQSSDEASTSAPTHTNGEGDEGQAGASNPGTASAMLDELTVKGRAPKTGYDGDLFKWRSDTDHNGCDTRNDVLRRDLTNITLKAGTRGCIVLAGTLADPYAGETYDFDRSANAVDIDHVVARSNAWQTGAFKFDEETLKEFGNDPLNLLAVSSSLNRQKGDGDAATWLPPNKSYRCEYVARQIAVKHKYDLWVVPPEKVAMERVLDKCEDQPAFAEDVDWPAPGDGDNVTTKEETRPPSRSPRVRNRLVPVRRDHRRADLPAAPRAPRRRTSRTARPPAKPVLHPCAAATPDTGPTSTATATESPANSRDISNSGVRTVFPGARRRGNAHADDRSPRRGWCARDHTRSVV